MNEQASDLLAPSSVDADSSGLGPISNGDTGLPPGWIWTTLGELCEPSQYGWTTKAAHEGTIKFLRTTDISRGPTDWATVPYCTELPEELGRYLLRSGDLVVSRSGSVGLSSLVVDPPEAVFASYLIRFRPLDPGLGRYLANYLQSPAYWREIAARAVGIGMTNVNAKKLGNIPVPLPPRAEQDRIVEALKAGLTVIADGEQLVARGRSKINDFDRSLSAAAFSGRLCGEEPGSRGFPDSWDSVPLGEIADRITSGSRDWKPYYGKGPGVFIMAQNVRMRRLQFDDVFYVDPPRTDTACERSAVEAGDVLVTIVGAGTGTVARVPTDLPEHWVCQSVALIRPNDSVLSEFLELFLASESGGQRHFGEVIYGQGRPHLGFDDLKSTLVPLPPLSRQREIVERYAANTAAIRPMMVTMEAANRRSSDLRTAVLATLSRVASSHRIPPRSRRRLSTTVCGPSVVLGCLGSAETDGQLRREVTLETDDRTLSGARPEALGILHRLARWWDELRRLRRAAHLSLVSEDGA